MDEQSNPNEGLNEEAKDEVHGLNENDDIRRKSASRLAKIRPKLQKSTISKISDAYVTLPYIFHNYFLGNPCSLALVFPRNHIFLVNLV